jgi:hypothetical protein
MTVRHSTPGVAYDQCLQPADARTLDLLTGGPRWWSDWPGADARKFGMGLSNSPQPSDVPV